MKDFFRCGCRSLFAAVLLWLGCAATPAAFARTSMASWQPRRECATWKMSTCAMPKGTWKS